MASQATKLTIAARAIEVLPPKIKAAGIFFPAEPLKPGYWSLLLPDWRLLFADDVLLRPDDAALSSMLDVWAHEEAGKALSVTWMRARPWLPPRIVRCQPGPWQSLLEQP